MENIAGKLPRLRVRMGVIPTKVERDRTKYSRKVKHKLDDRQGRNPAPCLFVEGIGPGLHLIMVCTR